MADVFWFTAERGDCTLRSEAGVAHLTFHPSGTDGYLPLDDDLPAELHHVIGEHIGRVLLIRYRGNLNTVTVEDLGAFGAPIVPEEQG